MEHLYSRNRIYISPDTQEKIKSTRILLGGAGLGSEIAECALRLGFENITILDGEKVKLHHLNRQNFTREDIGIYKAEALALRLLAINPKANIRFENIIINENNLKDIIKDFDVAVNTLDFKDSTPQKFDERCQELGIYSLHPYNFGWGGMLMIVAPNGLNIKNIVKEGKELNFEFEMAKYIDIYSQLWNIAENQWFHDIVISYLKEHSVLPPSQLSIGSWITAGLTVNAIVEIILGHKVKLCPKFYLLSFLGDKAMDGIPD